VACSLWVVCWVDLPIYASPNQKVIGCWVWILSVFGWSTLACMLSIAVDGFRAQLFLHIISFSQ
jgi:hypothetical protein